MQFPWPGFAFGVARALLLTGGAISGCTASDEPGVDDDAVADDDSDGDDDSAVGDDPGDDDSAQDAPAGDWPEGLPPCGDYQEPPSWFEVSDLGDLASSFFYGPNNDPIPGTVSVDGDVLAIDLGEWEVEITWARQDVTPPMNDGDSVSVFCSWQDADAGNILLVVFDAYGELVLLRADEGFGAFSSPQCLSLTMSTDYSCEYTNLDSVPLHPDLTWYGAWGRSASGYFTGAAYDLPGPGMSTTTHDGRFEIQLVRYYVAVAWEWSTGGPLYEFLMELVAVEDGGE